jgi:hypothetical protein
MHGSLVARCGSSLTAPALNRVYTQSSKRRHDRGGHLFLGRDKALLGDSGAYLLELSPYIVLNPVRAGMVHFATSGKIVGKASQTRQRS